MRLFRTYSGTDVGTANLESKSVLRAVAGQVCREYAPRVWYFPAYAMAMGGLGAITGSGKVFKEDGIHVREDFAQTVISNFQGLFGV